MTPQKKTTAREQLLLRAQAVGKISHTAVPSFANELAGIWAALQAAPEKLNHDGAVVARIRAVLAANRSKFEIGDQFLMERLANFITEPAIAYSERGRTWNEAFARVFANRADSSVAIHEELKPLDRLVKGASVPSLQALLYPLGEQIYSLRILRLPETGLALAYFFQTGLVISALPFDVRFVLCARLSGIAAKQTALLLATSKDKTERVSKTHRADFLALKQSMGSVKLKRRNPAVLPE